jgi:hypothetical protein
MEHDSKEAEDVNPTFSTSTSTNADINREGLLALL